MAVKGSTIDNPVGLESRPSRRQINLTSWKTQGLNHWKQAPAKKKKKVIEDTKKRPLGSVFIFPSNDPYSATQRMEFRAVHENVSWINRAIKIMVATVTGWGFTMEAEPRDEDEQIPSDGMDKWKQETRFSIPWADDIIDPNVENSGWSVAEIEKFIENLSIKLDLQSHISRAYRYTLEQGNCGIMMLPEWKYTDDGEEVENSTDAKPANFIMPRLLRTIRPEHIVKIWLNQDTGEMSSLQIIGLASRGGKLPVDRLIWFMSDYNLEWNSDYYGESRILPLVDVGKNMIILYGKDFTEAAQYTWHQPRIFKVTVPPRDYKKVSTVLKSFLNKANNSAGRDIAVTQSVELISGSSNTGDISGLIALDDHMIDQVAGFFNIPPFLLSKGKAGNLGGNAQLEEIDAFLNVEVRPQQEILESFIDKQFIDSILKILFNESDIEKIPIRVKCNLIRPDIRTVFDKDQYEILLDLLSKNLITQEKFNERMNIMDSKADDVTITEGGDSTPGDNTIPRRKTSRRTNSHWSGKSTWSKREIDELKGVWKEGVPWKNRPKFEISQNV